MARFNQSTMQINSLHKSADYLTKWNQIIRCIHFQICNRYTLQFLARIMSLDTFSCGQHLLSIISDIQSGTNNKAARPFSKAWEQALIFQAKLRKNWHQCYSTHLTTLAEMRYCHNFQSNKSPNPNTWATSDQSGEDRTTSNSGFW